LTVKWFRPPNALKHGTFSKTVVFPWEDAEEFEALHRHLRDEWNPSGPLEEDAVFTMLTCLWRKARIHDRRQLETSAALQEQEFADLTTQPPPFFDTKLDMNKYAISHPPAPHRRVEDRVSQLLGFSSSLYGSLSGQFLDLAIDMLGKEFSTHLRTAVPKQNYATPPDWVQAVKREVDEILLPRVRAEVTNPANLVAKAAAFITTERILEDLMLEERLDAMIDRAIRRLAQGKMLKEVAGLTAERPQRLPAAPLKIVGPRRKQKKLDEKVS
jgi:hypothetical protein